IDGSRDLSIDAVVQKAFISVSEKGTEATAATGIIIKTTDIPGSALPLTVANPFIFLIRDRQTGLILFMGKVVSL
ncbi:MAG: serpin family protein, partial [Geobacteraceae bacterium]